jgi:LEA14-like dessication related protein
MKLLQTTIFFLTLSTLTSCTYLRDTLGLGLYKPRVSVKDIDVTKADIRSIKLQVSVLVDNPNSFDLKFSDLNYTLRADDALLASGNYKELITIPSDQTRLIPILLEVDTMGAIHILQKFLLKKESVLLRWHARAFFTTPFGNKMEVGFFNEKRY